MKNYHPPFLRCYRVIMVLLLLSSACFMCCQERGIKPGYKASNDVCKTLVDSAFRVISKASQVTFSPIVSSGDTTRRATSVKIGKSDRSLVNFIVLNPRDMATNRPVYGVMFPTLSVRFSAKKETVYAKYDFGLRKWSVHDSAGNTIAVFDLYSDNMLRYAATLFPDDSYLQEINKPSMSIRP